MTPVLQTTRLAIGYPDRPLSEELDLVLNGGVVTCLLGENGRGKSTLIRTLAGLLPALKGRIVLGGHYLDTLSVRERARQVAVVLSAVPDVGHMDVYTLVALGRHPYTGIVGRLANEDHEAIRLALTAVNAEDLSKRYVSELSDGERQKVMIARALAQNPRVLLLDEPTSHLDFRHRVDIMRYLKDMARETGRGVLMSTHDIDLVQRVADEVWLLTEDGRVVEGTPRQLIESRELQRAFGDDVI